jgi:hypothetical protein
MRWLLGLALAGALMAMPASLSEDMVGMGDGFQWDPHTYVTRVRMMHPASIVEQWPLTGARSTGAVWESGALVGAVTMTNPHGERCGYSWSARPEGNGRFVFSIVKWEGPSMRPLPAPRLVSAGSSFDADLYMSGEQRIYDHYEITAERQEIRMPETAAQTQAKITLTEPSLYLNGYLIPGSGGVQKLSGPLVTIGVPDRGYFVIALEPGPDSRLKVSGAIKGNTVTANAPELVSRFKITGIVKENVLEFQDGHDQIRIQCSAPIAAGIGRPVYVFAKTDVTIHDVMFGAGDLVGGK